MNDSSQGLQGLNPTANSTLINSCKTSNQVSRANIFGLLLTLSLILLTQPFGSLFYHHVESRLGKLLFLFWRLIPLACLMEAIAICSVIVVKTVRLWQSGHGPFFRQRHPQYGRMDWQYWEREYQMTAAALLLLRAKKRDKDGRDVAAKLFGELELEDVGVGEPVVDGEALRETPTPAAPKTDADTAISREDTNAEMAHSASSGTANSSNETPQPSATPDAPVPGIIRKRTTMAEEATLPPGASSQVSEAKNLSAIKEALGSNAMSHAEIGVDFFTFVSVIFVIIKLAATKLPWHIRLYACCMISGWTTVQLLLVLLHRKELSELDMEATVVRAWSLRRQLHGENGDLNGLIVFIGMLVPGAVYCYLSYLCFWSPNHVPNWVFIPYSIICGLFAFFGLINYPTVFMFVAFLIIMFAWIDENIFVGIVTFIGGASSSFMLWAGFIFPMISSDDVKAVSRIISLLWNYATSIVILAFMLLNYDPMGTSQPAWVSYLG